MKIVIIHYNTPKLTISLLASLMKQNITNEIVIFENSDKMLLNAEELFDYTLIDNSKNQVINFNNEIKNLILKNKPSEQALNHEKTGVNFGSVKHALTVQWLIDNLNDDFILLDSDVLIKKDIRDIVDTSVGFVSDLNKYRVLPFLIYFNVNFLKQHDIHFFDGINIHPFKFGYNKDTGGSFLEECKNKKITYKKINYNDYIVHYGSGSWRKNVKDKSRYQENYKNFTENDFLCKYKFLFM
jgi:hypothetical protein